MKTTLHTTPEGFDFLEVEGKFNWYKAMALPEKLKGAHGIDDWVLPDRMTLAALAKISPSSNFHAWSASSVSGSPGSAWFISFVNSRDYDGFDRYAFDARLVRSSQCLAIGRAAQETSMKEAGILK